MKNLSKILCIPVAASCIAYISEKECNAMIPSSSDQIIVQVRIREFMPIKLENDLQTVLNRIDKGNEKSAQVTDTFLQLSKEKVEELGTEKGIQCLVDLYFNQDPGSTITIEKYFFPDGGFSGFLKNPRKAIKSSFAQSAIKEKMVNYLLSVQNSTGNKKLVKLEEDLERMFCPPKK